MKILDLGKKYDLYLSYTWSSNNHGICGHTFEVLDYYYILKDHFRTGILIGEDMNWDVLEKAIRSKYDFTDSEIADIKANTTFANRPSLVRGTNILFTDGGVVNNSAKTLLFDNIFYFACGNREIKDNQSENVYVLQDDRVYEPVKKNGIHYVKKILFDKLKPVSSSKPATMIYGTKNCRDVSNYQQLVDTYGENLIAIVNSENTPKVRIQGVKFVIPPVEKIFEQFSTYVYTPVSRKWDCSPRFIAECKYYGKTVKYHNIDYWDEDHGLRVRVQDIENDFESLFLTTSDNIIEILRGIL
jgi:hypothetical protein